MKINLLIFDSSDEVVAKLALAFRGRSELSSRQLEPSEIPKLQELDALYLTLPAAERWNPRFIFYQSQVLKTQPEDNEWPPYVVTGIAMKRDDPRAGNAEAELKLVMKAVLDAIESYNQANQFPIRTVGFWTENLGLKRTDASMAGEIIRSVYDEHYSQTKS